MGSTGISVGIWWKFFLGPNGDWMGCFMVFDEDFKAFKEDLKGLNADFVVIERNLMGI